MNRNLEWKFDQNNMIVKIVTTNLSVNNVFLEILVFIMMIIF